MLTTRKISNVIISNEKKNDLITRAEDVLNKAKAEKIARELAAEDAIKKYVTACLAIFCLTIFTHLPVWAAATLTMGLAVFPAVYIFRLYCPLDQQR